MNFVKLKEPFYSRDIEWRVQRAGASNNKPWAMVLAYVTNRAIMNRLDDVCGPENWRNEFTTGPDGGVLCGISIFVDSKKYWVTKWDGADKTQVEAVKGGLSGAMKRAAVQWGIGRYLYDLESTFAVVSDNGKHYQPADKQGKYKAFKWDAPQLPGWAVPKDEKKPDNKAPAQAPQKAADLTDNELADIVTALNDCRSETDLNALYEGMKDKITKAGNKDAIIKMFGTRKADVRGKNAPL